jgi:uncharacterized membrane protein YhaH (DUF805 family)
MRFCTQCGAVLRTEDAASSEGAAVYAHSNANDRVLMGDSPQRAYVNGDVKRGLLAAYINMWKNYANFTDRTRIRDYWMTVLAQVIVTVVWTSLFFATVFSAPVLGGILYVLFVLYGIAIICPGLAITVRRLRDGGKPWQYIFFSLIPMAGGIILIVFLCGASAPDDGRPVV